MEQISSSAYSMEDTLIGQTFRIHEREIADNKRRINQLQQTIDMLPVWLRKVDDRFDALEARMDQRFDRLENRLEKAGKALLGIKE